MSKMPQDTKVEAKEENKSRITAVFGSFKNLIIYCSLFLGIILVGLLFDQLTKQAVFYASPQPYNQEFIGSFVRLTFTINTGAAWGMGGGESWTRYLLLLMSYIVALGLIGYFVYLIIAKKKIKIGLWSIISVIFAGDFGNLIDRQRGLFLNDPEHFGVIDFLDINAWFPGGGFGIFNIADSFLVCGIIALIIYFIVEFIKDKMAEDKKAKEKEKDFGNGPKDDGKKE